MDDESVAKMDTDRKKSVYISSFFAGGVAGFIVDVSLFPFDTLRTRLQSSKGFWNAGGFKHIYRGIGPQMIGSIPQAAAFFLTYETLKYYAEPTFSAPAVPFLHMSVASVSEMVACLLRCPIEIVKQRRQTFTNTSSLNIAFDTYRSEGFFGFYRGLGSMIVREIPYAIIQFPIWEYLKSAYRVHLKDNEPLEPWEVANCGAVAGGFAAATTTPLDVVKTRIMLAEKATSEELKFNYMLRTIYKCEGVRGLFSGFWPRVTWITLGGYIFFGMYDFSRNFCDDYILDIEPGAKFKR